MATNIDPLRNKQNNAEQEARTADVPANQKLGADEFIQLVNAVRECQNPVKVIRQSGVNYSPNGDGVVLLPTPSGETTDSYISRLEIASSFGASTPRVIKESSLVVPVKFMSILSSGGERLNAGISGTIHIERSTNNFSTATEVSTIVLQSHGELDNVYDNVDIGQYLQEGEQQIRLYATYQYTDTDGITKVATSPYATIATITLTDMSLEFTAQWQTPFNNGSVDVGYFVRGYGQMLLYVEFDGVRVVNGRSVTTSTETPVGVSITNTNLLSNGLHTVRAWLAAAGDSSVVSDEVESQILYFDEASATTVEKQTAYVMVSDVKGFITPYVETKIFDYAVYKYGAESVALEILFTNSTNTTTYLSHDLGNVAIGGSEPREYRNALQIPSGISTAYMRLKVNGTIQSGRYWSIGIDQSIDFSPTSMEQGGFIFDASTRSNEESHPEYIINALNNQQVTAEWSSGMNFTSPSGYVESEGEPKHLHIPAGEWLKITGYDPMVFSGSMTMEFDVKISNIFDEKVPVIRVGRDTVNGILGFEMLPLTAYLMTEQQHAKGSQDIQIGEDERTHITVNIIRNIGGRGINFVRLFVNGIINREFIFGDTDSFVPVNGSGGIQIGSNKAEVDVYSIRVYKQSLSSHNIRQDYLSTISTAQKKVEFYQKNNILGGNNTINYALTKQLYSTMLWIPDDISKPYLPNYTNGASASYSKGTLKVIFRYRYATNGHQVGDINYDLSRIYTHMKIKGQGTSSMTYWTWNIRFQFSDKSEVWSVNAALEKNALLLTNVDKEEDDWECYGIFEEGGAKVTKLDAKANWASSSQSHKMGMMNAYGSLWKDIIGTRNPIYNADRKTRPCVLQEAFMFFVQDSNGDASQVGLGENNSDIRFSNFMTFGPAKNDKGTWGLKAVSSHYVKSGVQKSMYTCLEGSSNGRPLAEAKVPWITDEVFYYFNPSDSEDPQNETFIYNGDSQFDFDKGPAQTQNEGLSNEYDVPNGFSHIPNSNIWQETSDMTYNSSDIYLCSGNTVKFYRRAFNFAYLNTHHLEVIEGDYNELVSQAQNNLLDNNKQYFVMNNGGGHSKGDCFRYNPLSEKDNSLPKWVNAGITKDANTTDGYAVLNLITDLADYMPTSYNASDALSLKNAFITARLKRYRGNGTTTGSSLYWDEVECDLCQAWGKVMAAKDNWCKNTYFVLRPDGKITMYRDDDDTIMDKDNVGKTGTPYQVEEHDRFNDDGVWADENGYGEEWDSTTGQYNVVSDPRNTYWNSQDSVLFTLREQTRGGYRDDMGNEMRLMVGTIFQTMVQQEGSVDNFFQKYFFDIQEYFPVVAYNEVARLLYEEAKIQMEAGNYTNNTDPMTQSLGDQLQGEKQWIKRRIPYMESFGHSSIFADSHGSGALSFRSSLATTDTGSTHSYAFTVTPHQFLYPAAGSESSTVYSPNRTRAGETTTLPPVTVTQNNNVFIYGINYLRSVGDFAQHPTEPNSSIGIVGERLLEWVINENGNQMVQNRSASITFTTPRLQRLVMRNCTSLNSLGSNSLRNLSRLVSADLRGCTSLSTIVPPATPSIETLYLPANLTSFSISDTPNLTTLYFDGYSYLTSLIIGSNVGGLDVSEILQALASYKYNETDDTKQVSVLRVSDIRMDNVPSLFMAWLAKIPNLTISGIVSLAAYETLTFDTKESLVNKFGNIDDENNYLYVIYSKIYASSISLDLPLHVKEAGRYPIKIIPNILNANDFLKTEIEVSSNYLGITYDSETGELVVPQIAQSVYAITITGRYYNDPNDLVNGYIQASEQLEVYDRPARVGDFVYADGDYHNTYTRKKTCIGVCFYINPNDPTDRRMFAVSALNPVYKNAAKASFSFGLAATSPMNGITLEDSPSYNVYDVPVVKFNDGAFNPSNDSHRNAYLDGSEPDGFTVYPSTDAKSTMNELVTLSRDILGHRAGEVMPRGKYDGLLIIEHRNKILSDSGIFLPVPAKTPYKSEFADLVELMENITTQNGNERWKEIYYPSPSLCYAYEPNVEDLADKFKAHNWWLPSMAEVSRMIYYAYLHYLDAEEETPLKNAYDNLASMAGSLGNFVHSSSTLAATNRVYHLANNWAVQWNSNNINAEYDGIFPVCQF